jgi:hypothetical protein
MNTKIVWCKCGKKVIMAALMPYAEKDTDLIRDFKKYEKQGSKIELITSAQFNEIGLCSEKNCANCEHSVKQLSLF